MKEGWICPRCGKVNAPFIPNCDCKPDEVISNAVGGGITYICDKCGATKKVYNSEIT